MRKLFNGLGSGEEVEVQLVPRLMCIGLREQLHLPLPLFSLQQPASLPGLGRVVAGGSADLLGFQGLLIQHVPFISEYGLIKKWSHKQNCVYF